MLAILNFLNAHNLPIFLPILMILVSKIMVHRALSDKTYLSLGLLSPLIEYAKTFIKASMKRTKIQCKVSNSGLSIPKDTFGLSIPGNTLKSKLGVKCPPPSIKHIICERVLNLLLKCLRYKAIKKGHFTPRVNCLSTPFNILSQYYIVFLYLDK